MAAKALGFTRCGWMPALRPHRFLLFPRLGLTGEVVELFHASPPPPPALRTPASCGFASPPLEARCPRVIPRRQMAFCGVCGAAGRGREAAAPPKARLLPERTWLQGKKARGEQFLKQLGLLFLIWGHSLLPAPRGSCCERPRLAQHSFQDEGPGPRSLTPGLNLTLRHIITPESHEHLVMVTCLSTRSKDVVWELADFKELFCFSVPGERLMVNYFSLYLPPVQTRFSCIRVNKYVFVQIRFRGTLFLSEDKNSLLKLKAVFVFFAPLHAYFN